jgi:peroxiredoxin Q/BCP
MIQTVARRGVVALTLSAALASAAAAQDSAAAPLGPPTAIVVSGPEQGMKAPDFLLPWADKNGIGPDNAQFSLAAHKGEVVVLAFYPGDFTPGCTAEMRTFADRYQALFGDAVVVGISTNDLDSHVKFAQSLGLPFRLLSDPKQRVSDKYGAKGAEGHNRRVVYVIGRNGKVAWREMQFVATDPKGYDRLHAAIAAAEAAK